jgi:hypothetical protein
MALILVTYMYRLQHAAHGSLDILDHDKQVPTGGISQAVSSGYSLEACRVVDVILALAICVLARMRVSNCLDPAAVVPFYREMFTFGEYNLYVVHVTPHSGHSGNCGRSFRSTLSHGSLSQTDISIISDLVPRYIEISWLQWRRMSSA